MGTSTEASPINGLIWQLQFHLSPGYGLCCPDLHPTPPSTLLGMSTRTSVSEIRTVAGLRHQTSSECTRGVRIFFCGKDTC